MSKCPFTSAVSCALGEGGPLLSGAGDAEDARAPASRLVQASGLSSGSFPASPLPRSQRTPGRRAAVGGRT